MIDVAFVYKYLPAYRSGVFKELLKDDKDFDITFYSGNKEQEGIKLADWGRLSQLGKLKLAPTIFYKPSLLLWQKGIVWRIISSKHQVFILDGAISHVPVWFFLILCKFFRKKALLWSHGFKGIDHGLKLRIRLLFFKYLASGNILYGHTQRNVMIDLGFRPETLTVIYNSLRPDLQQNELKKINGEDIYQSKSKYFVNPDSFTLIFIGRLVKRKKVNEVIQLCVDLKRKGLDVNCIIIGTGEEQESLKTEVLNNNLMDQIHFAGAVYKEEDIAHYFAMSDLMVSPGNVGLNCIHSLGYGVPVMTHDNFAFQNPEVEAIEDGKTGVLFKYGDYNDMLSRFLGYIKSGYNKETTKNFCFEKIQTLYNPINQARQIKIAVENSLKIEGRD
ncbi:glycosyltransferase [Saccharicrinis sp. 156]|uniref:glycosyltransferase n=1 Tax=Saccharicrinis sp. 156 TaxID=3417574 RepID=UPI003D32FD1A